MKKEIKQETEKVVEIYGFTHKEVTVTVKIDYKRNEISLLESYDANSGAKRYIFGGRGVEYMQGWLNILEAMQEAVKDAKKRYEAELAERSAFKNSFVGELAGIPVFVGRKLNGNPNVPKKRK